MVGPAVFLTAVIVLAPFVAVLYQVLFDKKTGALGLTNLQWLGAPAVWPAFLNTLTVAVGSVLIELLIAVPLAILLNQRVVGRGALRALVTLPWAIPTITVATAFL